MRITVLAGGVGAARFLRGLRAAVPDADITVIGNTGDDFTLFGLQVCPDLDTVMYTLGGGISEEQGWGRAGETHIVLGELAAYGAGPDWFGLGDLDIATHILRDSAARGGAAAVGGDQATVRALAAGRHAAPDVRRPGTYPRDRPSSTGSSKSCISRSGGCACTRRVPALKIEAVGAAQARPAPGVLEAIADADFVLFPPSNPVVSIGVILAVPGIADAVAAQTVVGVSPIIGGAPVRGMADACLAAIGVATTADRGRRALRAGTARRLAGRRAGQGRGRRPRTGRHRGPQPAAVHDQRGDLGGDRQGGGRAGTGGPQVSSAALHACARPRFASCRSLACRRSRPGQTWAR